MFVFVDFELENHLLLVKLYLRIVVGFEMVIVVLDFVIVLVVVLFELSLVQFVPHLIVG